MRIALTGCSRLLALALMLNFNNIHAQEQPVADPAPTPTPSSLRLTLEEFATIPASGSAPVPSTRIVYLSEIPDDSGRLVVPDLNGKVWLLVNRQPIEFMDVADEFRDFATAPGIGTGLAFITFHPDYADNGLFYTAHSESGVALTTKTADFPYPGEVLLQGVVTEWKMDDPAAYRFSGTHRELMRIGLLRDNHGMQQLGFNPTAQPGDADYGMLYIAMGESERPDNWSDAPQNLSMPHGKIMRIDPLGNNSANGQYGIPADNPFVGMEGAMGEIFAYGMRNPHRFSWDPATGKMYVGMLGESTLEMVFELEAGDNLGWNLREGHFLFNKADPANVYPLPENDGLDYVHPVAVYDHDDGNAIVLGFPYRGDTVPELQGKLLFGDIRHGHIRYVEIDEMQRGQAPAEVFELILHDGEGNRTTMKELSGNAPRVDLRFGFDANGEIYVLSKANGMIWKIAQDG